MTKHCDYPACGRTHYAKGLCHTHYEQQRCGNALTPIWRALTRTVRERFDSLTQKSGGCLNWTGHKNQSGYGTFQVGGRSVLAHRFAWEAAQGPIADGMTVDHICFNRACVKIEHLRLLPKPENSRLRRNVGKSACIRGHEFTSDNTYVNGRGARICRTCRRERSAAA